MQVRRSSRPGLTGGLAALAALGLPGLALAAEGLVLFPDWKILLVNLVVIMLIIAPVTHLLLKPLVAIFEEREARTDGANENAELLLAEGVLSQDQLEERIKSARAQAQEERARILGRGEDEERTLLEAARRSGSESIERVRSSIADELEGARSALQNDARELAREAAARILGRAV